MPLDNFLLPSQYNWQISDENIIYNEQISCVYTLYNRFRSISRVYSEIKGLLKKYNQIHIRTHEIFADVEYSRIFNTLFKPTDLLNKLLDTNLSAIGGKGYISITLRFRSSLGDFFEDTNEVLDNFQKQELINNCLKKIIEIHDENEIKIGEKILVCSDSVKFLQEASKLDFVYIIPGEVVHIDYNEHASKELYMKSFVDYFMLSFSRKLYLIVGKGMYESGFAYRASLHSSIYHIVR
jgi:hypothetical protein